MQTETLTAAHKRERTHAKLLSWGDRQVLAFVQRDNDGALAVILQLWVAATDEQLQINMQIKGIGDHGDTVNQMVFDEIDDEKLPAIMDELGIPAIIRELEQG